MKIVVAYTDIHPRADAALQRFAPKAERIKTAYCDLDPDCGSPHCTIAIRHCHHERCDTAYSDLLTSLWVRRETFLLIEHDIELHEGVIEETKACHEDWCVWPYPGAGWSGGGDALLYSSLGCTKFSTKLMRREQDAMSAATAMTEGLPPGDWRRMDVSILPTLRDRGYAPHVHSPPVIHHHVYPLEGCACGTTDCST